MNTCGPVLKNNGRHFPYIFKIFCENTSLQLYEDFNEEMPAGYRLNYAPKTKYDLDIYRAVCDIIFQSQFNAEVLVDLLKTFARIQHRGNIDRLCTAFTQKSATGKSEFMNMLCQQLCTSVNAPQMFGGKELNSSQSRDGSNLAVSMNRNLLTAFEELEVLDHEFKLICGFGELSQRRLYTNGKMTLRINSHLMLSTNSDPRTSDAAVLARLIIFERRFAFTQYSDNVKIPRNTTYVDLEEISDELGAQMIVEYLPRGRVECGLGYYFMIFLLNDIFLNTFNAPVSLKLSATLKRAKNKFIYHAQPARYILDNNLLISTFTNPMPLDVFDSQATCLFKSIGSAISKFKINEALAELRNQLSKFIDHENNLIFIKFK